AKRALDIRSYFGVSLHEPGGDVPHEVAEHVVRNDELPVHVWPGAEPVNEAAEALTHKRRRLSGYRLEQNRAHPRALQCLGIAQQLLRRCQRFSLDSIAPELPEVLWRKAEVPHDCDAGIDHRAHSLRDPRAALALHRVAPGGHERPGAPNRGLVGWLIGQERQI